MLILLGVFLSAAPATKPFSVTTEIRLSNWYKDEKDAAKKQKRRQEAFDRGLEQAKQAALKQALTDAVASLTPGPAADSLMAREQIFDKQPDLVTSDEVTEKHTDELLTLTMQTTVQLGAIDKTLDDIRTKMALLGQKKVLVAVGELTYEPNGDRSKEGARHVLAATLAGLLKSDGWAIYDGAGRFETGEPSHEEIDRVATELGVDQVLTGLGTFKRQAPNRGGLIPEVNERGEQILFFVGGDYAIELVDAGSWLKRIALAGKLQQSMMNNIQASKSYSATELEFAKVTTPAVAAQLREKMLVVLSQLATNGMEISVVLTGVDLAQVASFEKLVKKIAKVKDVNLRGDFEGGKQTVEVKFIGTASELATAITKTKGHKLTVTAVKKAFIELGPR